MRNTLVSSIALSLAITATPRLSIGAELDFGTLAVQHMNSHSAQYGLDANYSFRVRAIGNDALLARKDVRLTQYYRGVKVDDGEIILHMNKDGTNFLSQPTQDDDFTDDLRRGIDLNTAPTISPTTALAAAHRALAPLGPYETPPTATLVITALDNTNMPSGQVGSNTQYRLAYHVSTLLANDADGIAATDFLVDAQTGGIIRGWSSLKTAAATGTGYSQYSGTVSVATNKIHPFQYEMLDTTRGTGGEFGHNAVTDAEHRPSALVPGPLYTDSDNHWGDGIDYRNTESTFSTNGQTAAVDAAYAMAATWDLYQLVFGRNGIDDRGKATYARVHVGDDYYNAYWMDSCFCMSYGDGPRSISGLGLPGSSMTALDIGGHEMTHGVTSATANLRMEGESGGLNEATSDIMGNMVEFYKRGPWFTPNAIEDVGGTWTVGEELSTGAIRYMYHPSLDGRSVDTWSSSIAALDPHLSSGVGNHFFFLLSHGASISDVALRSPMANGITSIVGIGNDKAAKIWYRALTVYMTPGTDYHEARLATLLAAIDYYGLGSVEYATVDKAWRAVNVM